MCVCVCSFSNGYVCLWFAHSQTGHTALQAPFSLCTLSSLPAISVQCILSSTCPQTQEAVLTCLLATLTGQWGPTGGTRRARLLWPSPGGCLWRDRYSTPLSILSALCFLYIYMYNVHWQHGSVCTCNSVCVHVHASGILTAHTE